MLQVIFNNFQLTSLYILYGDISEAIYTIFYTFLSIEYVSIIVTFLIVFWVIRLFKMLTSIHS